MPQTEAMLESYRQLGRALFVVVRSDETLSSRFATFVLSYICAADPHSLADRSAIGTTGSFDDADADATADGGGGGGGGGGGVAQHVALEEAERVLAETKELDPDLAKVLRRMIDTPLNPGFDLGEDFFDDGGEGKIENTQAGRARFVCSYMHRRLIASRRKQLEAIKDGFCRRSDEVDLRPALGAESDALSFFFLPFFLPRPSRACVGNSSLFA